MNKEYIYLSDKELIVTDEEGHLKKRIIESDNMHDLLLLENRLEKINNLINKINNNKNKTDLNKKDKIIIYLFPLFLAIFAITFELIGASINNTQFFITDYISLFGFSIIFTGLVDTFIALGEKKIKQENLGRDAKLSKAYEIKESLEKELSKIKEKNTKLTKSNEDKFISEQNDVIILEEDTHVRDEITKQLNDSYMEGYNQGKTKKLILTKNK